MLLETLESVRPEYVSGDLANLLSKGRRELEDSLRMYNTESRYDVHILNMACDLEHCIFVILTMTLLLILYALYIR